MPRSAEIVTRDNHSVKFRKGTHVICGIRYFEQLHGGRRGFMMKGMGIENKFGTAVIF